MSKFAKEYIEVNGNEHPIIDHNGSYDYRYVAWIEEELEDARESSGIIGKAVNALRIELHSFTSKDKEKPHDQ